MNELLGLLEEYQDNVLKSNRKERRQEQLEYDILKQQYNMDQTNKLNEFRILQNELGKNRLSQANSGESKSIDDIISASDVAEFLSKAMADKTNVESSQMPMKEDITKYSSDDPLDLLFKMQSNQRRNPSNIEGLMKILEDLSKTKPKTS